MALPGQAEADAEAARLRIEEDIAAENAEALRLDEEAMAQHLADVAQIAAEAKEACLRIEEEERIAAENAAALE